MSEPEGLPPGPEADLTDYVRELDETSAIMVEYARRYVKRPVPSMLDGLMEASAAHLEAAGQSLGYVLELDTTVRERITLINSLLKVSIGERARALNSFLDGSTYIPPSNIEVAVPNPETGETLALDEIPEDIDFADKNGTLGVVLETYASRLGAEVYSVRTRAESHGMGRVLAVGRKASEYANGHSAGIALGLVLGFTAANKLRK